MLNERARRWLPYRPSALFDLAADVERYPAYIPGWRSARIEQCVGEVRYAEQEVGVGPMRMRFRSQAALHRPERIEVTSDDAQFRRFLLLWRFEGSDASGCCVDLSVELELRSRFLQRWLDTLSPAAASEVLLAFERHALQTLGPPTATSASRDR